MKLKIIFSLLFITGFLFSLVSQNPLEVREYKLSNGLTVYLNEDHSMPVIMGAVAIKGGSKCDPKHSTGIAHYLEHMMFKGTDKLGTTDYASEKIWLDSISLKYDELAACKDENQSIIIQKKINEYSLKAAEYAIPNEFDRVIAQMGGSFVNAFTSDDNIVYFNLFPPNQTEKWMMLYSHRFINPVFRLFQSELETVYEEKNMSMDDFFSMMYETFMKNFFKVKSYGQQTVLGSIEHLKKPSLTEMYKYFETYYVANNMALMLSGDFNQDEIIPLIEKYFGVWRNAEIPQPEQTKEEEFKGREFVEVKMTPVNVGIIGFRGVKEGHPDQIALDIISEILYNNSSTGFFNKLYTDNKIMMAMLMQNTYVDDGGIVVIFVPKILKQSLQDAEELVMNELNRLKKGDFSDEYLETIKLNLIKYHKTKMENLQNRPFFILNCFNTGQNWQEQLNYPDKIARLSKADIIAVANKYFTDNCLVLHSKMGTPKKEKLTKPPYEPVVPPNTEAQSEFSKALEEIKTTELSPKFIIAGKDVLVEPLRDLVTLYTAVNPMNDVFSLEFEFGVGSAQIPMMEFAANYLSLLGTQQKSYDEFNRAVQSLGSSISFSASKSYFRIRIDGLEQNLEPTLKLLKEILTEMKDDPSQLDKFPREAMITRKTESKSPDEIGYALKEFALYNEKSVYLNRLTVKEIKKLKSDSLLLTIKKALSYELQIHYCGQQDINQVKAMINHELNFLNVSVKSNSPVVYDRQNPTENLIYILNDKDLIQSQIYIMKEGNVNSDQERSIIYAFNEYFGAGMNSIIFQEIREFRSLAYTAYGTYQTSYYKDKAGFFSGFLSTQSDKSIEAISAMTQLLSAMPEKSERMETIRAVLLQSINSNYPSFRSLTSTVADYLDRGYSNDPNIGHTQYWKEMNFDQLSEFFKNNLQNKSYIICIAGDASRIDMKKLAKFGKIIEVSKKDIFSK